MRQFTLTNANDDTFDMQRNDALFVYPDGLGFEISAVYSQVENSFIETDSKIKQPMPTGQMIFKTEAAYNEFLAFVSVPPLVLGYAQSTVFKYITCTVSKWKKNEYTSRREWARVDIDFTATGQWRKTAEPFEVSPETAPGKTYPYTYPYTYTRGQVGTVEIENTGTMESPLRFFIRGACSNPAWLLKQNGVLLASGAVEIDLTADEQLIVDSRPDSLGINKCDLSQNVLADAFQQSDFEKDCFISVPVGISELIFSQDTGVPSVTVEVSALVHTV